MTFSAHSTEVRAMCQHAIPYCRLFADQVRPWVEFAIWTEQPTWGESLRTFQRDAKIASPIKDKSHKTPESAPAAGDLKPACDDLALNLPPGPVAQKSPPLAAPCRSNLDNPCSLSLGGEDSPLIEEWLKKHFQTSFFGDSPPPFLTVWSLNPSKRGMPWASYGLRN